MRVEAWGKIPRAINYWYHTGASTKGLVRCHHQIYHVYLHGELTASINPLLGVFTTATNLLLGSYVLVTAPGRMRRLIAPNFYWDTTRLKTMSPPYEMRNTDIKNRLNRLEVKVES